MGYVTTEELTKRDLYRNFTQTGPNSNLRATNEDRAASYVKYKLDKTNFANVISGVDVKLTLVKDSLVRRHVQITSTCTYNTPFGEIFNMFGMNRQNTFSVTACADCTDIADYVSTTNFLSALASGTFTAGTGLLDSVVKMVNSFVKLYNHLSS